MYSNRKERMFLSTTKGIRRYDQVRFQDEDMLNDLCRPAKVVFSALEPIDCREYRKTFMAQVPADCEDPKQLFIDDVMKKFDAEHQRITEKEGTNN